MNDAAINIGLLRKKDYHCLAVSFPYNQLIVGKVRTIEGRKYDAKNKRWEVPLAAINELKSRFPNANFSEGVNEFLEKQKKVAELKRNKFKEILEDIDFEKPLSNGMILFKHQIEAIQKMILTQRQILAHDMGLGKTLSALIAAKLLRKKYGWKVIIVCPVSLKNNWLKDAKSLGINIEVHSWAKVPNPIMEDYILICDEAHYAQSGSKSQRGQKFLDLSKSSFCKATYLLSGTPIKNGRPINLLPLLQATRHILAQDKTYFEKRYCNAHLVEMGGKRTKKIKFWDANGISNLSELYERTKDVMLRRTKKECLDLPDKLRVLREVEVSKEAHQLYKNTLKELKEKYLQRVADGTIEGGSEAFVLFGQLRQAGSLAKVETTIEIAKEILEENQQIVIFTEFRKSQEMIYNELSKIAKCEMLHGQIDQNERPKMVERFQAGQSKIFISTIGAGGVGLTLTKAQTVLLVDRPLTPGDAEQAEDRCHRIGQKNNVTAIWLQYGNADAKIDEILIEKSKNIEAILTGKENQSNIQFSPQKLAMELLPKIFSKHQTDLFE